MSKFFAVQFFCSAQRTTILAGAVLLLTAAVATRAFAQTEVVPLRNYVNDYAGVVPDSTEQQLNALLKDLQQKTGAQIAVVVIPSTEGVPAADYAVEFGQKWGVVALGGGVPEEVGNNA